MEVFFQQYITEAKSAGITVLLSSHILAQVEALADRISIIRHGRIVETGTLSDMRHMSRTTLIVETTQPTNALTALRSEEHTSELQSRGQLVCRLLPAKKK